MGSMPGPLTEDQRARLADDGFVRIPAFADRSTCTAMLERVIELVHSY